jgi:hypothetical protein
MTNKKDMESFMVLCFLCALKNNEKFDVSLAMCLGAWSPELFVPHDPLCSCSHRTQKAGCKDRLAAFLSLDFLQEDLLYKTGV